MVDLVLTSSSTVTNEAVNADVFKKVNLSAFVVLRYIFFFIHFNFIFWSIYFVKLQHANAVSQRRSFTEVIVSLMTTSCLLLTPDIVYAVFLLQTFVQPRL